MPAAGTRQTVRIPGTDTEVTRVRAQEIWNGLENLRKENPPLFGQIVTAAKSSTDPNFASDQLDMLVKLHLAGPSSRRLFGHVYKAAISLADGSFRNPFEEA